MAAAMGDSAVAVFGGKSQANEPLGDTWLCDVSTRQWTRIESSKAPSARAFGTLTARDTASALLFGGCTESSDGEQVRHNDLFLLHKE